MSLSNEIARYLDGDRPNASIALRALAGAAFGGIFAAFTPLIALMWLVEGAEYRFPRFGLVRLDLLTLLYPLGAIVSGALFSLLVSYCRNRIIAAFAGMVALVPWFTGIAVCSDRGYATWSTSHTVGTTLLSVLMGGYLGWFAAHMRFHKKARDVAA